MIDPRVDPREALEQSSRLVPHKKRVFVFRGTRYDSVDRLDQRLKDEGVDPMTVRISPQVIPDQIEGLVEVHVKEGD